MTRSPLSLQVDDLSAFARDLAQNLGDGAPSHLTLLNMLARSAGFQNVQHLRASQAAGRRLRAQEPDAPADPRSVERALHQFDQAGRLTQWPSKRTVQTLALWALWAALPANTDLAEKEINARLRDEHLFGDPATLRRTMIACTLLTRVPDGSVYRRIEQKPPAEARALIHAISVRRASRASADA